MARRKVLLTGISLTHFITISSPHSDSALDRAKNTQAPIVEDRLNQYHDKYLEKRKEVAHALQQEEKKEGPLKPKIDEVSEKIVAKMDVSFTTIARAILIPIIEN